MSHLGPSNPPSNVPSTSLIPSQHDITVRGNSTGNVAVPQRGRRRSTVGNVLHTAETIKEKQVLISNFF